jgi:pimeloyl-ACP methyl ester carboxylesterase
MVGAACIAGVAPYGALGLDFLAGMGADNIDEFGAALQGEATLQHYLECQVPESPEVDLKDVAEQMKTLLCQEDLEYFEGPNGEQLAKLLVDGMQKGRYGWLDDELAFTKPWEFLLDDIRVPVQVWQGSEDLMVPFSHGQWLADNIPGAESHLLDKEGHISIFIKYISEIHEWLRAKF